jgi:hypothetical protein
MKPGFRYFLDLQSFVRPNEGYWGGAFSLIYKIRTEAGWHCQVICIGTPEEHDEMRKYLDTFSEDGKKMLLGIENVVWLTSPTDLEPTAPNDGHDHIIVDQKRRSVYDPLTTDSRFSGAFYNLRPEFGTAAWAIAAEELGLTCTPCGDDEKADYCSIEPFGAFIRKVAEAKLRVGV